ncbi:CDP-alcohol phosphatidyltransferase family protein [Plantactinospora sp. KBS50]|uniref:CDP-alcohol phosphatidyltransferase family protein n=1 Tax=Plantactinospora sp. KBS50 TaxID=2024580 RepID=UPI000BAAE214|nr:CDP-alcohol phosphatidyltransferase family protein [Plantactinospora sp. KBS50]ASW54367.1 phosphatidate cytidylyltransferase [Plantactinospora sp. KBS50]
MNGLYALKPWYTARLDPLLRHLVARRVPPVALTVAGVGAAVAAGAALALLRPGLPAALLVGGLLAIRLGCANLDGAVARRANLSTRRGAVANELGDRLADLAALAGAAALAPPVLVLAAALAACAPSWVALAGAAAGAPRIQGGPVGKTERCALLVAVAATGWATPLVAVLGAGSAITAGLRLIRVRALLGSAS